MLASSHFLSFCLYLLVFCHGAFAQLFGFGGQSAWQSSRSFAGPRGCRFDRLDALNPTQRLRFEAGMVEYYDVYNEVLQCAGVSARRITVEPRGLFLPQYNNAPSLVYIIQGRGIKGVTFPGCPETFQSFQPDSEQILTGTAERQSQQRIRDEHQKVHRFKQGDIIALPAGVTYWGYNDGDIPVVAIEVFDTSNTANQLEPRQRSFFLAGRHSSQQTYETGPEAYELGRQTYEAGVRPIGMTALSGNNIFNGFDTQLLAEALGVNVQLARQLQAQNDPRGQIVFVKEGLKMIRPLRSQEIQQQEFEESMQVTNSSNLHSREQVFSGINFIKKKTCTTSSLIPLLQSNLNPMTRKHYMFYYIYTYHTDLLPNIQIQERYNKDMYILEDIERYVYPDSRHNNSLARVGKDHTM
ncbi:Glutelin [Rhynchospora pubera]|uniref:Glutelin n=1 Tax=Rhynchospora pubera TaxID=906938 RepID=A0AAV8G2E2_9POAL|nr:Glutelin [Rhynchospora pubera]